MKDRHKVSREAVELVKQFEGYRRTAARLPDGRWTVGHGHTQSAREGAEVDAEDAEALLIYDLMQVSGAISQMVFTPLNANEFDALVCFGFNIGIPAFARSNVLRLLNEGQLLEAAYALESWRKAEFDGETHVFDSLVRRRACEKALFLTPVGGFVPSPSALIQPKIDPDALFSDVVVLTPLMEGDAATVVGGIVHRPHTDILDPRGATAPAEEAETVTPEHVEAFYDIPGYAPGADSNGRIRKTWIASLRTPHLLVIGLVGAGLLVIAFTQAMKNASAGLLTAVVIGLAGSALVFLSLYQTLNRLDGQED